ncbi:MAG: hypothetical protein CVV22_11230 [Ignavibacteriae bacterium HGW-Ignavibacteriae-1]|jgi:hypothetical protein|nr:MAG: hypothetical protein CVV22_11230 [Ignavibacteriae bacterium HGW-Ignavibacteriae-1]
MKSIWHIAICIIIIIPVIYFPYSGDLWIYVTGGQVIAEGGKIFKDFVDLKPPFLFMIFSVIYSIFGNSEINVRFAEFLIQSGIIISLYYLMRKVFDSANLAFYGTFFYALSYGALTHTSTFQTESFLPLFILPIIYLRIRNQSNLNLFLQGLFIGLSGGLKYTFIAIYPAMFLADLFAKKQAKVFIREQLIIILGVVIGFGLTFVLLLDSEVRTGFWEVQNFTYLYAQLPEVNFALFKFAHEKVTYFFGNHLSMLFVSVIIIGLFNIFSKSNNYKDQKQIIFLLLSIALFLLLTVFVEKKFAPYHFTRIFIPLSFIFAIGTNELIKILKYKFNNITIPKIIVILIIIPFVIFFSPLPRYMTVLTPIPHYYLNKDKYLEHYNKPETHSVILKEMDDVVKFVKNTEYYNENDKIMVMSVGCQTLNYYLDNKHISKFPLPLFPMSGVSKLWLEEYIVEIKNSDILIVQTDDSHPIVSGYIEPTLEKINENAEIKNILQNDFHMIYQDDYFVIYNRN